MEIILEAKPWPFNGGISAPPSSPRGKTKTMEKQVRNREKQGETRRNQGLASWKFLFLQDFKISKVSMNSSKLYDVS